MDRFVVDLFVLAGAETFLFDDFWCPPLIVCREELLGLVEAWRVDACLDEEGREAVACLLDALLFAGFALLDGELALLAEAPPLDALWRMRWAMASSGNNSTRVKRKAMQVSNFL